MNTEIIGNLIIIIMALTGVIKSFIPDRYKKAIPVIPLLIGLGFAFLKNIDWITMLVAVITSIGTYTVSKGIKKDEEPVLDEPIEYIGE